MMNGTSKSAGKAFTLLELLVVIPIISLLAAMLLPTLWHAKERGKTATCLNNLRQLGIATSLYISDHNGRFPRKWIPRVNVTNGEAMEGNWNAQYTPGGPDPQIVWLNLDKAPPPARYRPLNSYLAPSGVYHCPKDAGQAGDGIQPSNWDALGCSYQYNCGGLYYPISGPAPPGPSQLGPHRPFAPPFADWGQEMADKSETWVTDPVREILYYESPARIYGSVSLFYPQSECFWYQWHSASRPAVIFSPIPERGKFLSPIQFVDGDAVMEDFTRRMVDDPWFPYRPTAEWRWYKSGDNNPN